MHADAPAGGEPGGAAVLDDDRNAAQNSPTTRPKQAVLPIEVIQSLAKGLDSSASWLARELDASIGYAKEDGEYDANDPRHSIWILVHEREAVQVRDWLRRAADLLCRDGAP